MTKTVPSTNVHRAPARSPGVRRRPALVCAYPKPLALPLPDSGTVIGRAWLADRDLDDSEVSGQHIRIDRAGGALAVIDVDSRNGTWVSGARVAPNEKVPLDDGAVLRIGRTLFVARDRFEGDFAPAAPVGELVGPFGLRTVARSIDGLAEAQPTNVLLEGETGVGKELTARALAAALGRAEPFAAVNVAGIAGGVFESQMFGHVAGAFSGAGSASAGVVVAHDGGTLFLDEIGELELPLQAKLLRLLDNREVMPVGAQRPVDVDIVVIAATNRDLAAMVEQASFRRDLFTRLAMARIHIPPLRDRCEDLFSVAAALTGRAGGELLAKDVEVEAMERLLLERWPGNVRELDATLAAARRRDPEPGLRLWALEELLGAGSPRQVGLTRETVERAVDAADGNVSAAAAALGISRGKLLRIRKKKG